MINVQDFLLKSNIDVGVYALVSYDNKIEPVYFSKHNFEGGDWFLESPCELYKVTTIDKDIDEFSKEYVNEILEDGADIEDYIAKFIKPMIVDDVLYEIENFQCSPYLPKEVEDIKIVTERECLLFILNEIKGKIS